MNMKKIVRIMLCGLMAAAVAFAAGCGGDKKDAAQKKSSQGRHGMCLRPIQLVADN